MKHQVKISKEWVEIAEAMQCVYNASATALNYVYSDEEDEYGDKQTIACYQDVETVSICTDEVAEEINKIQQKIKVVKRRFEEE